MRATLAPLEAADGRLANACSMSREWMMRSRHAEVRRALRNQEPPAQEPRAQVFFPGALAEAMESYGNPPLTVGTTGTTTTNVTMTDADTTTAATIASPSPLIPPESL